ncbi:hypothetical protein [Chlamydia pecorum]|nr:hypothetical protein [Chlamydia pecorum]
MSGIKICQEFDDACSEMGLRISFVKRREHNSKSFLDMTVGIRK